MIEMLLTTGEVIPGLTWTNVPFGVSSPREVYAMGFTSAGTDLYCYGGNSTLAPSLTYAPFWKYNTVTKVYTQLTSFTSSGVVRETSLAYANGRVFAIGSVVETDLIKIYNVATGNWSSITTPYLANARAIATVARGNRIYCIGGSTSITLAMVYYIDAVTLSLVQVAPLPEARSGGTAFTLSNSNEIYYYGGTDGKTVSDKLFKYTLSTNTWVELPAGPVAAGGLSSATVNGVAYISGFNNTSYPSYVFTYDGNVWKLVEPRKPAPPRRWSVGMASVGNELYLFGGYNGTTLNDLWVSRPS